LAKELTKEEYEQIITENRHKELKLVLGKIAASLSEKDGNDIVDAIKKQGDKSLDAFEKAINSLPKPEVNIEINQDLLISSMGKMRDDILKSNYDLKEAIETRLLPDTFTLKKGYGGVTESVKVNYIPANKINK
jgi:hypothetical protein